jgi:hypothetical protein
MDDLSPPPQARVIPIGEPVEGGIAVFEGSVEGAIAFLADCSADQRADVSVWTDGHMWSVEEFLAKGGPDD